MPLQSIFIRRAVCIGAVLMTVYALSWLPWFVLRGTANVVNRLEDLDPSEAAIIFGGLHKPDSELSETNQERLAAGALLLNEGIVNRLVISNTADAAHAMWLFLVESGVAEEDIELDLTAVVTEDSCVAERNHYPEGRSLVFVSHGYHLPRLMFACERLGVLGVGVAAEEFSRIDRAEISLFTTVRIRFVRYQREAILTVLNMLGVYDPTVKKSSKDMSENGTTLIVLRGPSGSGKSTIATSVRSTWPRPMALIEQDYFRRIILKEKDVLHGKNIQLIRNTILFALEHSYDVIMEGIFDAQRYGSMFEDLLVRHPRNNHFFYFDISFEETLRRHQSKPNKDEFGEEEMRKWYKQRDLLPCTRENIIPETNSFQQSVDFIQRTVSY